MAVEHSSELGITEMTQQTIHNGLALFNAVDRNADVATIHNILMLPIFVFNHNVKHLERLWINYMNRVTPEDYIKITNIIQSVGIDPEIFWGVDEKEIVSMFN